MSIFSKIMTAVRGGAREVGESIVDANSIRIFEQEIRDAENHLTNAKRNLTDVMAKQMQAKRSLERAQSDLTEHEGYAVQALNANNEALALEVAEKIAQLEKQVEEEKEAVESLSANAERLKDLVKRSERQLAEHQRQLTMVKTTDSVQKATSAITDNFTSSSSKLLNAKESLERIKQKQQDFDDRMVAAEELTAEGSDQSLKDKLAAAGIGKQQSDANSVLARLKAKQSEPSA